MAVLSLAKRLGILAVKTFGDAIASGVKKEAGCPPKLRQFFINLGQTNHKITTRMERRFHGLASNVPIHPLGEERAIQAAALLLAELSVYTVAGATVIFGVKSYVSASKLRKERIKQELEAIKTLLAEFNTQQQYELHAVKQVQLHAPEKVELTPNQVDSKQMLDEVKELLRSAIILNLLRTLLNQVGKSNSN